MVAVSRILVPERVPLLLSNSRLPPLFTVKAEALSCPTPDNCSNPPFTTTVPVKPELFAFRFKLPTLPVFITSDPVPVMTPE